MNSINDIFQSAALLPARYTLLNAHVPAALLDCPASDTYSTKTTVRIANGFIESIEESPSNTQNYRNEHVKEFVFDLQDATLVSAFVDPHTHLDKGDLLSIGLHPEQDLFDAIKSVRADYAQWTEKELRTRIEFALQTAWVHGSRAINTFCDWAAPGGPLAWHVLKELRQEWAGRIELVLTSLARIDQLADHQYSTDLAQTVADGQGVLGWFIYPEAPVNLLSKAFDLAERFDLRLDFHVDEHLDPPQGNLGHVTKLAQERDYGKRTVCGHCCVLANMQADSRDSLLDAVAKAQISMVCLPFTNLYLQDNGLTKDKSGRKTPRLRGLFPVHEARARAIQLAFGSDNHRDPFFPAGDLDPLQTLSLASLAAQLDNPVEEWIDTITSGPARLLNLKWDGVLRRGAPADLIIHRGRNSAEVISRVAHGRIVLRDGQRLPESACLPDFRQFDNLRADINAA